MADIPVPRSYSQTLGQMVDALLSRLGLPSLKVGSPALSILEAAAQSDLRSSQDIFNLLDSISLDRATGLALDRIGADEDVQRLGLNAASGTLTVSDTSFTKINTRIYRGFGAPIVGSTSINVEDGSLLPSSGNLYIGRNTLNYEGPIPFSAVVNNTTYWTIALTTPTTKFHNLGESVILAQGGNRNIPAGTNAQTPPANAASAVQFSTLYAAIIPDGETSVENVSATARVAGSTGNVVAGSVTQFVSAPFTGAAVTNPNPFSNGLDTEDDDSYRERIREARASRTKGTPLAIQSGVIGITSLEENKRVLSANVVERESEPTFLYIDDGTGYEEVTEGVPYEEIVTAATGGEQYFNLANGRPVTKAFVETSLIAPYDLTLNSQLSVTVNGVTTVHTFGAADFRSMDNASAFEVASSINANYNLLWSAQVAESGTKVVLFAKADTNESLQVVSSTLDANESLGFPTLLAQSLWLYKNDQLLSKDGDLAFIDSRPQSQWGAITNGSTLNITIDGVALTITINDIDWVNAGTTYAVTNAFNSLAAWVQLLNFKIPGVTVSVNGGSIRFTSNSGRSSRASLAVTGGPILASMFGGATSNFGSNNDYTLDRNLGQIKVNSPLATGDTLTAASVATRAFIQTTPFLTHTIASVATSVTGQSGAELWLVVDGNAQFVNTSAGIGTAFTITSSATSWGFRVHYNVTSNLFSAVRAGDWLIATDLNFVQANRGAYLISNVDAGGTWVEIERNSTFASNQSSFNLASGGFKIVRTRVEPQRIFITSGTNYTAYGLATLIQPQLLGATASAFHTQVLRIRTNGYVTGDIAFVAGNTEGLNLGFTLTNAIYSGPSHLASLIAGHSQLGTPNFVTLSLTTISSPTVITAYTGGSTSSNTILVGAKTLQDDLTDFRFGHRAHITPIVTQTPNLTLKTAPDSVWSPGDRLWTASPYSITARDQLAMVIDNDELSKRYIMNMYRKVKPTTNTYGAINAFSDVDGGNVSLSQTFGQFYDWTDYAVFMKARVQAQGILWRYYRHGFEGDYAKIRYIYPTIASQGFVSLNIDTTSNTLITRSSVNIDLTLRSGIARSGYSLRNSSYIAEATVSGPDGNSLFTLQYVMNLIASTGQRDIRLNYTLRNSTAFSGVVTGGVSGATATVASDSNAGGSPAASGFITITGVVGTFLNSEPLFTGGGASATDSGSIYGYTTITLTLPGAITDHGLQVGDAIWFQSTNINFSTSPELVVARTTTTISYTDIATTQGATATPGRVSKDVAGEVTLSGSTVAVGDIFSPLTGTGFNTLLRNPVQLLTVANDNFTAHLPNASPDSTVLTWYPVNNTALVSFFPIDSSNTLTNIVSDIAGIDIAPVSGFIYGTPSATILSASYEAPSAGIGGSNLGYYNLTDGINWVQSNTNPVAPTNVSFTFKDPITAGLATGTDWQDEDVRLVPITALNVTNYLNSATVSGLFEATEIVLAEGGQAPQITSLTLGSAGAVAAEGGTANSVIAPIVGSTTAVGSIACVSNILASEDAGLTGNQWVLLQNEISAPKSVFTATTQLSSIAVASFGATITLAVTNAWNWSGLGADNHSLGYWNIEKQGSLVCYTWNDTASIPAAFANVHEGDWVFISNFSGTMQTANTGWFKVVRADTVASFFIENPIAVEEWAQGLTYFLDYNSIVPGDTLVINGSDWGVPNMGTWTVVAVNFGNQFQFIVNSPSTSMSASGALGALGSDYPLFQVFEAKPARLFKFIHGIVQVSESLTNLKFNTSSNYQLIDETYGTVLTVLDKLQFGINPSTGAITGSNPGIDGYSHTTGLIEEANRVVYGDESNSSSYPGIAAAGANINIDGPLIKRIQISIALRINGGNIDDIVAETQAAIAQVVNETEVGQSVSFGKIVAAAQSVNNVVSPTIISPTYGIGFDQISVQPYEKAIILDASQDIQVSFVE